MPADALTTVDGVKTVLGINDATEDTALSSLVGMVSALIAASLARQVVLASNALNPVTEYLSGQGHARLILSEGPVQAPILAGNVTQGSPAVTGLSSTSYLFPYQSVSGPYLPAGSFVVSVDSPSQVTLNQAAAVGAAGARLVFGLGVWVDDTGYFGSAPGAFAQTSQLFEGTDFFLHRDQAGGGQSRRRMIERVNGVWDGQFRRDRSMLSAYLADGQGNVKVTYWAGLQSLPPDLELAAIRAVAKARNSKWYGDLVAAEGYEEANYTIAAHRGQVNLGLLDGDVAPVLARYRKFGLGGN